MAIVSISSPLSQPTGSKRLLEELQDCLANESYEAFGLAVAFAKASPLHHLEDALALWRQNSKSSVGFFGIDHLGTSWQALKLAKDLIDDVYIINHPQVTFHPKAYWFTGGDKAVIFIGSNNLTVGGTELNFEMHVRVDYELPKDRIAFEQFKSIVAGLAPESCSATSLLDSNLLDSLLSEGRLLDESHDPGNRISQDTPRPAVRGRVVPFPIKPPSSLPRSLMKTGKLTKKGVEEEPTGHESDSDREWVPAAGFVIQIRPHANGEIFLSRTAASQNPEFFGMPFTGLTVPKKSGNPPYPQRVPDPVCNTIVLGKDNRELWSNPSFPLNMVFYEKKSEIRITSSQIAEVAPPFSIMIMGNSPSPNTDYDVTVLTPENPEYETWLEVCNQSMPGGGSAPRRFGWF